MRRLPQFCLPLLACALAAGPMGCSDPEGPGKLGTWQKGSAKGRTARLERLARTDPLALLETCLTHCRDSYDAYTCTFTKQERIGGRLRPEQRAAVKFRAEPFSVAMHWTHNPPPADRVLYVAGRHGGKMLLHLRSGLARLVAGDPALRAPDDPEVRKNTLRPITAFGLANALERLHDISKRACDAGDARWEFVGYAEVDGRETLVVERHLPATEAYPAARTRIAIDTGTLAPTDIRSWDGRGELLSRYAYTDVNLQAELTDADFQPDANGITPPPQP